MNCRAASAGLTVAAALMTSGALRAEADPPRATTCTVVLSNATIAAQFDGANVGTVTVDGSQTRRFRIKSVPYSATYLLMFQGYGTGDQKPAAEHLTASTSVVARLVMIGDAMRLYLDSDYTLPGARASLDGYLCK